LSSALRVQRLINVCYYHFEEASSGMSRVRRLAQRFEQVGIQRDCQPSAQQTPNSATRTPSAQQVSPQPALRLPSPGYYPCSVQSLVRYIRLESLTIKHGHRSMCKYHDLASIIPYIITVLNSIVTLQSSY
jgi:hypothetical protein